MWNSVFIYKLCMNFIKLKLKSKTEKSDSEILNDEKCYFIEIRTLLMLEEK